MIKTRNDALIELGFEPNSEPSNEEIKKSYHTKALMVHPDKNQFAEANAQFITLTEALAFLSQPRELQDGQSNSAFSSSNRTPITIMNAKDLFANICDPSFDINNFFASFFAVKDAPSYRISVSIATRTTFMQTTMGFSDEVSFSKRLEKDVTEFTIHTDRHNLLPENGAALILEALLKQKTLISVKLPVGFLNEAQSAKLQTKISQNKQLQEAKEQRVGNREKQSHLRWATIGATLATAVALLTGQTYVLVLYYGAIAGYILYLLKKIHCMLVDKHYQNKKAIATSSPTEKEALKFGVEAITWRGYCTSFTHWQTYRHPQAFAAGMQHAQQENEKLIKTIRALP